MSEEEEEFQAVVTACLGVVLLGTETRLDAGLQAMIRVNWSAIETVCPSFQTLNGQALEVVEDVALIPGMT